MLQFVEALSRAQKRLILLCVDLALIPPALFFAIMLQFSTLQPAAHLEGLPWAVLPALLAAAAMASMALGIPRIQLKAYELRASGRTALLAVLLGVTLAALAELAGRALPPGTPATFALVFFLFSVATRLGLLQILLAIHRAAVPRRPVVIYGAGATGMQLAAALRSHNTILPVAFVDDSPSLQGLTVAGLRVYPPKRLERLIAAHDVERVLLAMPSASQPKQAQIARRVADLGVEVQAVPSFAQLAGAEALVETLSPVLPENLLGRARRDNELAAGADSYAGRVVLVSGAGGSIGSELCRQLLACAPAKLVLYELSEFALYTIDMELRTLAGGAGSGDAPEIVPVLGTVTDGRQLRQVLLEHGVEVVLHAAAYKHVPLVEANPLPGLANNVLGTRTLAQAAVEAGVRRFVLVSSDKAVRPANIMGVSKRMAELVVKDLAARRPATVFAMVRFGNVLGSSGSVVPLFQEQIARGGPVTLTHEEVTRYFMTIREAARLVLLAGAFAKGGEVFVLDMGPPVAIRDLARRLIEASGCTVRDADNPDGDIEIAITGLRPGDKLHEELLLDAGLASTPHPKILRAEEPGLSELETAGMLRALRAAVAAGDAAAARALAARWVESDAPQPDTAPAERPAVQRAAPVLVLQRQF